MPQTKGGLDAAYLPETSMEAREANEQYQAALARLTEALDARKNRVIDPVMMSVAAGFLGPTQTGSFGEALGRVAEGLPKAVQAEEAEQAELAKAGLGVAQQNIALQRMREADRAKRAIARGIGARPPGGALGSGMGTKPPLGGALPGPSGGFRGMTGEDYAGILAVDPSVDPAAMMEKLTEFQRGAQKPTEGGIYNLDTGAFTPRPGMAPVKRQLYNFPELGQVEIPPSLAAKHEEAVLSGDPVRVLEIETQIVKGPQAKPAEPASGVAPGAKPAATGIRSQADIEAEKQATSALAKGRAETEVGRQKDILEKGDRATQAIQLANNLEQLASAPDAKEFLGLARQNDEVMAMITNLLGSGIGLPGGMSVGIPELPEIYKALRLTEDQQTRYQFFLQQAREMAIKMSEFAKGSVSNYEQTLFSQASVNENDLPATIMMKARAMAARAEFDKQRAELLDSGKYSSVGELKRSPEYKRILQELDSKYQRLLQTSGYLPKNAKAPSGGGLTADQIRAAKQARGI